MVTSATVRRNGGRRRQKDRGEGDDVAKNDGAGVRAAPKSLSRDDRWEGVHCADGDVNGINNNDDISQKLGGGSFELAEGVVMHGLLLVLLLLLQDCCCSRAAPPGRTSAALLLGFAHEKPRAGMTTATAWGFLCRLC